MDNRQEFPDKNILLSEDNKAMLSSRESLQLALLKFISCLAVIYVHSYTPQYEFFRVLVNKFPIMSYTSQIMSQYIARIAVPVFFAVSGYIYFSKHYELDTLQFFKRKVRGILLPYFIWNTFAIIYVFIGQQFSSIRSFFPENKLIDQFSAVDWVHAYISAESNWYPFLYPLWFLPYLFAAFMIVHIFRKYFFRSDRLIWGLLIINFILLSSGILAGDAVAFEPCARLIYATAFFASGKLLKKYQARINGKILPLICGILFAVGVFAGLAGNQWSITGIALSLYTGGLLFFALSWKIAGSSEKLRSPILFAASFSFLIYVTHEFALSALAAVIYPRLPAQGCIVTGVYLLLPLVLAGFLITGGYLLKRVLPKVYGFLFNTR